jgi:hypothetical protein
MSQLIGGETEGLEQENIIRIGKISDLRPVDGGFWPPRPSVRFEVPPPLVFLTRNGSIMPKLSREGLDEIYTFAVNLGKEAGRLLLDAAKLRFG